MKIIAAMSVLVVAACSAQPPPAPIISDAEQWRAVGGWQVEKAERDQQVQDAITQHDVERAIGAQRATERQRAAETRRQNALARLQPQARACLLQNAGRLAHASGEAADIVADAVLTTCHPYVVRIADADATTGLPSGDGASLIEARLRRWVVSLVVEARIAPANAPAALPSPARSADEI